ADIELALGRQPEIRAAVVVEIESPHGPEPLAVLILRNDQTNAEPIIDRANKFLAPPQQIPRWLVWPGEEFPRNAMQKVQRELIRGVVKAELAKSGRMSGSARAAETSRSSKLAEIIAGISKEAPATLDPSAKLGADLKLDSLGRVELLSALEDRYQV